jgi:hypothetical protein
MVVEAFFDALIFGQDVLVRGFSKVWAGITAQIAKPIKARAGRFTSAFLIECGACSNRFCRTTVWHPL